MLTAILLAQLIMTLSAAAFLVVCIVVMLSLMKMQVPFVPTSRKAQEYIVDALMLSVNSVLYDLGSGDGRVLATCFKKEPRARYVGIELHELPNFLAKLRFLFLGRPKNVVFLEQDIFKADLRDATHIFMYLLPAVVEKILPKLQRELKPGTRVVSCDFGFIKKTPLEVREIPASFGRKKQCRKLYTYVF